MNNFPMHIFTYLFFTQYCYFYYSKNYVKGCTIQDFKTYPNKIVVYYLDI